MSHPDPFRHVLFCNRNYCNNDGGGENMKKIRFFIAGIFLLVVNANAAFPVNNISECTTISSPGTYALNQSIINTLYATCISITSSDVILDGAGYTIDGTGGWGTNGVYVYNSTTALTNVTVKNLKLTDWVYGIHYNNAANGSIINNSAKSSGFGIFIANSDSNILTDNTADSNGEGIFLSSSGSSTLTGNKMTGNNHNFGLDGWQDAHFDNNINTSNTADGKPILYIRNVANAIYDRSTSAATFYCISCSNVTVKDLSFTKNRNGIYFRNTRDSRIENINASLNSFEGIMLIESINNTIINSTATGNMVGISILASSDNTFTNNSMADNDRNFGLDGWDVPHFNNNIDTSNTVNGKPILYIKYGANTVYDSSTGAGTFYCISCNNITVKDLILTKNRYGIYFRNTGNSKIENITSSNSDNGIDILWDSSNNTIINNTVISSNMGIYLQDSSSNTLINNIAKANIEGIYIVSSPNNTLTNNTAITNSDHGIYLLASSHNNTITNNTISSNGNGIYLDSSTDNTIYNNIFNNLNNAGFGSINANSWNITKTSGINIIGGQNLGGNFWAKPDGTGFSQTCTDSDKDGICDSSCALGSNNTDYLPLARNAANDTTPPASIMNLRTASVAPYHINWTWKNPPDPDFSHVIIHLNGIWAANTSAEFYNATNLISDHQYTISIRTADTHGNINNTWVNKTVATLPSQPSKKSFIINNANIDASIIPQTNLDKARSLDVLFNHQSTGYNILAGLDDMAGQNSTRYALNRISSPANTWYDTNDGVGDFTNGTNMDPQSKVNGFNDLLTTGGYSSHIQVAFMKFCWIDFWQNTDYTGQQIWNMYQPVMQNLIAAYPNVTFVWVTAPLQSDPYNNEEFNNREHAAFNDLLRQYITANGEILFDLADIESHDPNGTLIRDRSGYPALYSGYTTDGGHLDDAGNVGRDRVANAWWQMMAIISGWSNPTFRVTNLTATSGTTWINWTWIDPDDPNFAKVMVYLDGVFQTNVSKGVQYYTALNLLPDTEHTISTRTVDTSGNINLTWVNHTARTSPDTIPPPVIGHPRLWLRAEDLPRLRSWANDSNPIYKNGLAVVAARAVDEMDAGNVPDKSNGGTSWDPYPPEMYAELFAFMSLISNNSTMRDDYARRARIQLMYVMNESVKGAANGQPFRDPDFSIFNRARWYGQGFGLTVDWIYPYLTPEDKTTIRTVFLRWADENMHAAKTGYNHPEPIGVVNDPVLIRDKTMLRWSLNNFYTSHMRNIGLMSMALDPSDDPGNILRSYLRNATGAWLYVNNYSLSTEARGGLLPEGFEYSPEAAESVAEFLLALHTAGEDDPERWGQQVVFNSNPFWNDSVAAYLHSLSPKTVTSSWGQTVYQPAWYGDGENYWARDFIGVFGPLGMYDYAAGNTNRLQALRWIETNMPPNGSDDLIGRARNTESSTASIMYFMLFDPTAPAPSDPRPSQPLTFFASGIGRLLARTDWNTNATWFTYKLTWNGIDHQNADGNQFEFYRRGEWLTKERTGYTLDYGASHNHNTLALENDPPAHNELFSNNNWLNGSQWMFSPSGDPEISALSINQNFLYVLGNATNLYNSVYENSTDITHASRSIVWLKPDHVIVYDRAASKTANRFKRFWLNFPSQAVILGNRTTMTTASGQQLFVTTLLPADAVINSTAAINSGGILAIDEPMKFRLRVEPQTPPLDVQFLHVLQGADAGARADPTTRIWSMDGTPFEGALVNKTVILFPVNLNTTFGGMNYTVPAGTTTHLITGLSPNGSYNVSIQTTGNNLQVRISPGTAYQADSGGVLTFTAPYLRGDLNGNGKIDIGDVSMVAYMVVGKISQNLEADFNNNSRVDIGDASKLAYFLVGKVSNL